MKSAVIVLVLESMNMSRRRTFQCNVEEDIYYDGMQPMELLTDIFHAKPKTSFLPRHNPGEQRWAHQCNPFNNKIYSIYQDVHLLFVSMCMQ